MANIILSEEEYNELKKDRDNWRDWFYELRYALRKDEQLDESISCVRDIPSDVEIIEDLKKRAADSDCYKEMSELLKERNNELKEKLKKANELADSWKRDYERIRDHFLCPIYNILYPGKPDLCIDIAELLNDVKNLKVYSEENGQMFKELQEWREKCISRGNDIDRLLSENKEKDKKISELEGRRSYWEKKAIKNAAELQKTENDRDRLRELYNSLSNICSDYSKYYKEELERTAKLNQTISDQEVTIKALLITIKEMCKEENENA